MTQLLHPNCTFCVIRNHGLHASRWQGLAKERCQQHCAQRRGRSSAVGDASWTSVTSVVTLIADHAPGSTARGYSSVLFMMITMFQSTIIEHFMRSTQDNDQGGCPPLLFSFKLPVAPAYHPSYYCTRPTGDGSIAPCGLSQVVGSGEYQRVCTPRRRS